MSDSHQLQVQTVRGLNSIAVRPDERPLRLTDLLRKKHFPLNTRCGERGSCNGCLVEVLSGRLVHLKTGEIVETGLVRGCEFCPGDSAAEIRVPACSLLAYEPQVVSEFRLNIPRAHDPLWQVLEVPPDCSLSQALARANRRHPVHIAKDLPKKLGSKAFATLEYRGDHWLVANFSPHRPKRTLGAAIDVGTTTVALQLVDLNDGSLAGSAGGFNRQIHLGDDVATRIGLCAKNPAMLKKLQEAIVDQTILPLLALANTENDPVVCLSIAGNTSMLHLIAGVDPSPMGIFPFEPAFLEHRIISTPATHLLPGAAAYIGADLVAGILATGMAYDEGPSLLVDMGTNGEIILKHDHRLFGCATAAGPAFEGSGLTNGIRAGAGAIERIHFSNAPFAIQIGVIGDQTPTGICGSAYLDFLATAHRVGLINDHGRFEKNYLPVTASHLVNSNGQGWCLRITRGQEGADILISETDIASLLQAKAAIAAGIMTLLARAGLVSRDIKHLYLAGGFGMHLDVANAIACGLMPGFMPDQIQVVGNTSLAGAYLALLDCGVIDELTRISQNLEVVELNLDPEFESRYIDHLSLKNS